MELTQRPQGVGIARVPLRECREACVPSIARQNPLGDGITESIVAFLVAGLYLAALPVELFVGTRVPFPFIVYTIAVSCLVLFVRWRRLEDGLLAAFGRSNRTGGAFLLLIAALVFWFALEMFVSPCPNYARRKYALWLVNGLLPLIVGYLWLDKPERIDTLLRAGLIWVALVLVFWLASPNAMCSLDTRHVVLRGESSELTSCSFCRAVSLAAMACVVSVGLRVFAGPALLIPALLAPAMLYLALQSGSRGAVLSFTVGVFFFVAFSLDRKKLLLFGVGVALVAAAAFTHIAATNSVTGILDSGLLQGDVQDGSVIEHFAAWRLSASTAVRQPLGVGLGGYARIAGYGDEPLYPHNVLLETWLESGWVGLGLYACLVAMPFICLGRRLFADKRLVAISSLFAVTFLFAMTYLGIEGNNPYWLFLGGLWAAAASSRASVVAPCPRRSATAMELPRTLARTRPARPQRRPLPAEGPGMRQTPQTIR
jgi:O-antigen ligase